jgi:hypothetical protein
VVARCGGEVVGVAALEWPAHRWMTTHFGQTIRWPETSFPPCRGTGPLNLDDADPVYRDCSVPKLSTSEMSDPWILPGEPIPPALAASPDEVRELHDRVVAANRLRVPAYVSLATSGALLLGFQAAQPLGRRQLDSPINDIYISPSTTVR